MSKRFTRIYVEITNYCNLACSFCSKDHREKKEMTVNEFKIVVDKIKGYTNNVCLHVKGEPLLHSHIDEILGICDKVGVGVRLTTNGTLLKKKKDILLKHNIKQINVSLHCENNQINYFEDVFNTCDELKKKTTIIYRIWTLPTLDLDSSSTKIVDKINKHYHLSTEIVDKIKHEKNIKIGENVYIDKDYEFVWPKITNKNSYIGTCLGTRNHIAILSNGNVTVCCLDSDGVVKLGNIFNDSLSKILNSDLFKSINEGFKNNKIVCDLCKGCTYRLRFDKKIKKGKK